MLKKHGKKKFTTTNAKKKTNKCRQNSSRKKNLNVETIFPSNSLYEHMRSLGKRGGRCICHSTSGGV